MRTLRRTIALAIAGLTFTACENSTAPENTTPAIALFTGIGAAVDPTLVTFNSASCTLNSSSTGSTSCSWNISNTAELTLNLFAEALLDVTYDCVNARNGRVHSTEMTQIRTFKQYSGVNSATLTQSNDALPIPVLPTDFSGSMKKENACKGNSVPQNASWSLNYWDVSVITTSGTQRMHCFASDNRNGCFTS
jgi:hypothetical protein